MRAGWLRAAVLSGNIVLQAVWQSDSWGPASGVGMLGACRFTFWPGLPGYRGTVVRCILFVSCLPCVAVCAVTTWRGIDSTDSVGGSK